MKAFLILTCFFLLYLFSGAQNTFIQTYGGAGDDAGQSVRQTTDGGYILCGYTNSFGFGNYDAYIIRTTPDGDTLWSKTVGGTGYDAAFSVEQTSDNGFIVCGTATRPTGSQSDVFLIRLNEYGDTVWTNQYFNDYDAVGYSVQQTPDLGFIISGYCEISDATTRIFLIKTDPWGDTLWTRKIGQLSCGATCVRQTVDNGYILTGYIDHYNPGFDRNVYLVKTDLQGDTLWTGEFGGSSYEIGWSVTSAPDGYIITGNTQSFGTSAGDVYLVKSDLQGGLIWQRHYGHSGLDVGHEIRSTADEQYIVCGNGYQDGSELQWVYLLKINENGDTLWTRTYGNYPKNYGYSVHQTEDLGYILTGFTNSTGAGEFDVLLIKTDPDGLITRLHAQQSAFQGKGFPNPCDGIFQLDFPENVRSFEVRNREGRVMYDRKNPNPLPHYETIDVRDIPAGIYLILLKMDDRIVTTPMIHTGNPGQKR